MKKLHLGISAVFALGIAAGGIFATQGISLVSSVVAKESGKGEPMSSPVKARARDFYAPNSEDLAPDEMRLIACGTGMPTSRPKQAASCWLLELGNGDKFIFDTGTGSAERIAALQIPYNFLDKVFFEPSAYRPLRRSGCAVCRWRSIRSPETATRLGA